MKKWLEKLQSSQSEDKKSEREYVKELVYLNRIQKRIDRELDNFYWLCKNCPEIFLYSYKEEKQHQRLRKILLCIKALNPKCDVELVLKNLKDEPEPKKEKRTLKLINGETYELKDNEKSVPYVKTITLEGLNIAKEEKFEVPLAELRLAKEETFKIPFKPEGKKEKPKVAL